MTPRRPSEFTDTFLEEALSNYANVQPPAGMERRILARLTQKRANRQRLFRGLGVALVAMVVVTGAAQRFGMHMAFVGDPSAAKDRRQVPIVSTTKSIVVSPVALDPEPRQARATVRVSTRRHGPVEQEQSVRTGLISDLQLDSLDFSPLDLSVLSSAP